MGIFRDDPAPPLHVPDLTRPAGAAIGADGTVACVVCATRIALAKADVVGLGYRCVPCTQRAELQQLQAGAPDNAVNLHDGDRDGLRAEARRYAAIGALTIAAGLVLAMFVPRFGKYIIGAGGAALVIAWMRAQAAR